ncbi:formate dehydrogenase subunit delta [Motiliproteus sp. MSK22-1]|uniref:formate dehydrogenase subunit delta n=1 Tax=Motiliproteus sp. MSK22-1 TaxID=1897630 RepID=UPI000978168C|nr:formate dehydrogenase subunit delta [Motiliproteus sp. MSK22-1]OMH39484.1 hypothetical protein BGP75_02515 [Motiliproteus sp. MSK22-1]
MENSQHAEPSNKAAPLIKMINEITANNLYHGDTDATAKAVATHLTKFWARSMKKDIIRYQLEDGSGLSAPSKRAVEMLIESS